MQGVDNHTIINSTAHLHIHPYAHRFAPPVLVWRRWGKLDAFGKAFRQVRVRDVRPSKGDHVGKTSGNFFVGALLRVSAVADDGGGIVPVGIAFVYVDTGPFESVAFSQFVEAKGDPIHHLNGGY